MSTIKVQIIGGASTKSILTHFNETGETSTSPLTFHAYSDQMKARVLEMFIKSPTAIGLSFTDEPRRDGEWHEPMEADAIFTQSPQ